MDFSTLLTTVLYGFTLGWFCCFNWAYSLDNPKNREFVKAYEKFTKGDANVSVSMSSVHGYDAGQMIAKAVAKTSGINSVGQPFLVK